MHHTYMFSIDFCLLFACNFTQSASAETQYLYYVNRYIVYNLNALDTYTSYTVYEQDSLMASHKRMNYTCAMLVGYTAHNMICAYIAYVHHA